MTQQRVDQTIKPGPNGERGNQLQQSSKDSVIKRSVAYLDNSREKHEKSQSVELLNANRQRDSEAASVERSKVQQKKLLNIWLVGAKKKGAETNKLRAKGQSKQQHYHQDDLSEPLHNGGQNHNQSLQSGSGSRKSVINENSFIVPDESTFELSRTKAKSVSRYAKGKYIYENYNPLEPYSFTLPAVNHKNLFRQYGNHSCYTRGANATLSEAKKRCVCQSMWFGRDCGIPYSVQKSNIPLDTSSLERRKEPRRVIHGINVNHEVDFFEIRLHELADVIDLFIICESNYTAYGLPKNLTFLTLLKKGFFKEFQHKIVYLFLDHFPRGGKEDGWVADKYLRTFMGRNAFKQITGYRPDDIFVVSDADEVFTRDAILFLKLYDGYPEPVGFWLRWSYYGFFWSGPNDGHTRIIGAASLAFIKYVCDNDLIQLRRVSAYTLNTDLYLRAFNRSVRPWYIGMPDGPFAGWHCSWCFHPKGIRTKLVSAQNGDFPRWGDYEDKKDLNYIAGLIKEGRYFDGSRPFNEMVDQYHDQYYAPAFVLKNPKKFQYLLKNMYRN